MKRVLPIVMVCAAGAVLYSRAGAQQKADILLAPKPAPSKYVAPHKPITKLADLRASHAAHKNWTQVVVDDDYLHGEYIQNAPGTKVSKRLHPDTRTWWIVMDGEMRVEIEGQQPFTAKKGYMVQVPLQTFYSMETIGDKPSLRFHAGIAGAKTLFPRDAEPPKTPGIDWLPVRFARRPGVYDRGNKPYVTFEEFAENNEKRGAPTTQRFLDDDRAVANFIYGYESKLPPLNPKDKGHYHPECAEFWLVMAGQIRYPIEGQGVIIASEGDVVYVPKFTFHAPRFHGPKAACRLAMNGYPNIAHLFEAEPK